MSGANSFLDLTCFGVERSPRGNFKDIVDNFKLQTSEVSLATGRTSKVTGRGVGAVL